MQLTGVSASVHRLLRSPGRHFRQKRIWVKNDLQQASDKDNGSRKSGIKAQHWLAFIHLVVLMSTNLPWGNVVNACECM